MNKKEYKKQLEENLVKMESDLKELKDLQEHEYRKQNKVCPATLYEKIHRYEKMIYLVKGELKKCKR